MNQRGFSLIEVIIALGLLASVLISVSGMFVLGSRQVRSGRDHSTALSVACDILEEMNGWSYHQTYEAFEVGTGGAQSYPSITTLGNTFASRWQPVLDSRLSGAYGQIELHSVDEGPGGPPDLNQSRAIRVVVTVRWQEGPRPRSVQLATVRM